MTPRRWICTAFVAVLVLGTGACDTIGMMAPEPEPQTAFVGGIQNPNERMEAF